MRLLQMSFIGLMVASMAPSLWAGDWAVWRGPSANGISQEKVLPQHEIQWTAEVGEGYSAVSVLGSRLLTAGHVDGKDVICCLDDATGKELWSYAQESDKGRSYAGSLATPVTDGTRVWYFSRHAELICLDFATGKKLWAISLMTPAVTMPEWNVASSVLLYKDLAIVAMGDYGAAVDKETGKLVWASEGKATYSTPTILTYQAKDYLLIHGATSTSVVEPLTGKLLDQVSYKMDFPNIGASPTIVSAEEGLFFIAMGDATGRSILYAFDGQKLTERWNVADLKCQFSSPVYHDGVLYGSHGNTNARDALTALDAKTGAVLWRGEQRFGSPTIAGDTLIYLDERGTLVYLDLDKTKESVISSERVIKKGKCWQVPVVANGYLYCRNQAGTLVCIKVS